ncbi:hypothetical protein Leryth_001069 [Lithospermum erythrorhizon]|nr:hypothetical protein Leryth_001069 [Lithospermum erythrorhizon]
MASVASNVVKRLEGKVALITGAANGIGETAAKMFTKHGANVLIADINLGKAQEVCKELGPNSSFVICDVTKEADVENAVNTAISRHGKLDVMFNNAGITLPPKFSIMDNDLSEFRKVIDVNLIGVFLGIKHAARVMVPGRSGSIINTASVASTIGGSAPHAYTSSKHAVVGLTKNAAVELGQHGIRVNCISPYFAATPMIMKALNLTEENLSSVYSNLKGAILRAEDVAESALFLASDESKYISGHNLVVDGGATVVNPKFSMFEQQDQN